MQVEFTVLESELPLLHIGDGVEVSPFAGGNSCRGKVTEINPKVDEKGLVKARASLEFLRRNDRRHECGCASARTLASGWICAKERVVLRSGREVVFTLEEGKAMWNYVTTGIENPRQPRDSRRVDSRSYSDYRRQRKPRPPNSGNPTLNAAIDLIRFRYSGAFAVLMSFLALVILGCVTFVTLPVSLLPDVDVPRIAVRADGASLDARELENMVVAHSGAN